MLRVKVRNSVNLFRVFFSISLRLVWNIGWHRLHLEKLHVSIGITKLQSEVLNLLLKKLYHYVALGDKGITLDDLVLSVAYRLLTLGYHLVPGSDCCLKLFHLSDLPVQLTMGDLCLTGQVDNAADEPMAHQTIQFGSFIFDMKKNNMKEGVLSNTATWGTNLIFKGSNLLKQKMKLKRIIIIGTMHVEVEWSPT